MKNPSTLLIISACAAIALCSCSGDNDTVTSAASRQMTFTAQQGTFTDSNGSRALLDGSAVMWETTDRISLFDGDDAGHRNKQFGIASGAGTTHASLSGTASKADTYYAVYPYSASYTIQGNTISGLSVPATQYATADNFRNTNVMAAMCSDNNKVLMFRNVLTYMKISTQVPYRRITLKAGNGDVITGGFNVSITAGGVAAAPDGTASSNAVTLLPSAQEETIPSGTYYVAIIPRVLTSLEIEYEDANGVVERKSKQGSINDFATGSRIVGIPGPHVADYYYEPSRNAQSIDDAVDLGLPAPYQNVRWAKVNLGAENPWDFGDYYAWGSTEPWLRSYHKKIDETSGYVRSYYCDDCLWKTGLAENTYNYVTAPYWNANTSNWTKYTQTHETLQPEDDAATQQWGNGWRMPTMAEFLALITYCDWQFTNDYLGTKVRGYIVYNKSDHSKFIFLPSCGHVNHLGIYSSDTTSGQWACIYWTSTHRHNASYPSADYSWYFRANTSDGVYVYEGGFRPYGKSIRPVTGSTYFTDMNANAEGLTNGISY